MAEPIFFDRDLSWLSFNYRVLEEAARTETPLLERINFLAIYCSNLDEFYRVRIPALSALQNIKKTRDTYFAPDGSSALQEVSDKINTQLAYFGRLFTGQMLPALAAAGIYFIYGEPVPEQVRQQASEYFFTELLAFLQPVKLAGDRNEFFPGNDKLYFAVHTSEHSGGHPDHHSAHPDHQREQLYILNIPSDSVSRFYRVEAGNIQYILFIDVIILDHLPFIFPGITIHGAYSIKITRDAELNLEDEYDGDIAEKIERKLAKRDAGLATRALYQPGIPMEILGLLMQHLDLNRESLVEGGRYHNLRDLSTFPVKDTHLSYTRWAPLKRMEEAHRPIFERIGEKDILLHTPYESYNAVLQFFNEAAIDPLVEEVYLTMYRIARDSRIAHALISASLNGKKVTVFVELKARFDEANNLQWAKQMKRAGVKIIYSIPSLKVHAKVALVKKSSGQRMIYYGMLATGNLNENTARFYTDHILLTGSHDFMRELELLFIFLSKRKEPRVSEKIPFHHLLVAQFNLHERFLGLIDREIKHANKGLPASITIKLNNLEEPVLISKLYEASGAGVDITLIVRSICCIIPGIPGMSSTISVRRIVDRYLEHGRVFIFHNDGDEEIYLGSADWMNRNIYRRIEV